MNPTFTQQLEQIRYSPLDLLPHQDLREKLVDLAIQGVPDGLPLHADQLLRSLRDTLVNGEAKNAKVVIFGGGTGLSNILGGDSRQKSWVTAPFCGIKNLFPNTRSIVCITDNGGSTGELLKDLPLIAIGDIRHVLISSIQLRNLQKRYSLDDGDALTVVEVIAELFNFRFTGPLEKDDPRLDQFLKSIKSLPTALEKYLHFLIQFLFKDKRLAKVLGRDHCLGNLLCAAAIYRELPVDNNTLSATIRKEQRDNAIAAGLNTLGLVLGCNERAVLPCTPTPAQLRVIYSSGVEITGEHKLGHMNRGYPIAGVDVYYCDTPTVYPEIIADIESADIIIFAPGSLYSSIIPVMKVPGLASAVRRNDKALKLLVSNLWVQEGETDLSEVDPERKFHVSDMLNAYEKNIPGGTKGLFSEILCVSLKDIPASILQRYAVEGKVPIYLDQENLIEESYYPVQCEIFSERTLQDRGVIQHDPARLALAVRSLYMGHLGFEKIEGAKNTAPGDLESSKETEMTFTRCIYPCEKYSAIESRMESLKIQFMGDRIGCDESEVKRKIAEILWDHPSIPLSHLEYFKDIYCVHPDKWDRDQKWDKVFSFYDPDDSCVKIRTDQVFHRETLEIALMIALGESLLGNYARRKRMDDIVIEGRRLGRVYNLHLQDDLKRRCFFSKDQLKKFLLLARMCPSENPLHYTRLINKGEGFTPPGLLMGLMYAWYIDNRLATHIEYKMSVLKISKSDLIPEQMKMASKRRSMIQFFRDVVFQGLH